MNIWGTAGTEEREGWTDRTVQHRGTEGEWSNTMPANLRTMHTRNGQIMAAEKPRQD